MKSIPISTLTFSMTVLLLQMACKKEAVKPSPQETRISTKTGEISPLEPNAFQITIASGGGFTGLYTGYTLRSDGSVVHWQRYGAGPDSILWRAQGNASQIHAFKEQLEASGMLQKTFRQSGNLTTIVTLVLPDTSYTWTWSGTGISDATPRPLRQWYSAVETYCKKIK